ncbi:methyltransferase family protein [Barrientosiimonas humi]|uniref:Methyltransferase family protein n=1 Tax=Barrientosiimonas humi TaxID=999931 RepID=A0A542XAN9_9MICO|nr:MULTISPECIES: class I SAM-dependent methyltransferase [Barrientosiimonas]TQL32870.1 methyltransferase family protein [Barrientosiimonas humi]CAG7572861.1 hypothetical protein BH39T_PBIAJDOK_01484 [Barrientosiimonas humi]
MKDFDPATSFGPDVAARYDDEPRGDEDAAAGFLAGLLPGDAPDGSPAGALELAIGTGRVALPLAARGVRVDGIELSPDMVDVLRSRDGGADLRVVLGDMARETTGETYPLVFLVYNTIFNLLGQDEQVRCFENAARHLRPGGRFVVEAAVPSAWLPTDSYARPEQVETDAVTLDVCRYDPVTQHLVENHVRIAADGVRFAPIVCRLAWPSELDLMARLAGLRLEARYGGWHRQPYTGRDQHVSVYVRGRS